MTPEEHVELAEKIIANYRNERDAVKAAEVHVRIAEFQKRYPPEAGRPIIKRFHNHPPDSPCTSDCRMTLGNPS